MGGIITGIRKEIEEKSRSEEEVEGIQQREVVVDEERWRIVTVYNKEGSKEELDRLKEMIGEREEENMIIVGDFNARIGKEGGFCDQNGEEKGENGKERRSKDGVVNKQGCELMKVVGERGWLILNGWKKGDEEGEWTYEKAGGKSVIDYGIVNLEAEEKIRCFEIGCRAESDHQPIMIELGKEYTRQEKEKESEAEMIQDWSEEGIEIFRKNIEDVEWEKGEGEGRWEEMEEVMKRAPKMKRKGGRKEVGWVPWWDRECREKKREVNRAGRRYRRRKSGYEEFVKKRREYRDTCEKKEVEHKKLEEREIEKITTEAQAWEFINRRRKKKEGISKEIKRTEWVEYFKTALEGVDEKTAEIGERRNEFRKDEGISREEIRLEIKRLKKGKAAGIDGIRNEAWMMGGDKVSVKLEEIYRKIWEGEGFPEKWRIGVVVPIWKKGDKNVVGNYRGVTLTSTAYKIYANILNKKLVKELDEKGGWGRTQAGFRKGRGTIENIKILKHLVGRRLKEKKKVWAFFMDLKGAFDKIDRKVLWEMMRRRGISDVLIERVKEIYEETRCVVRIGGEVSKEFWVKKGVRQGCPLSPTLFNVYIADLEEELRKGIGGVRVGGDKVWSLEYADDIVVVAEEEVGLRAMIRGLQRYLKEKKLELSPEKSKVMVFRKKGGREKERYWWWGKERLEEVKEYKYLGYWVSRYGGETEHVRDRIRKARVAMGWVWSYGERKFKGDVRWRLKLFDSIVKGILLYGVEIWGYKEWKEIEALQEKYLRWILGVKSCTPGYIVREELKRSKMRVETGWRAGKFEERIQKGEGGEIGRESIVERRKEEREKRKEEWTRESLERREYLWRGGVSEEALNEWGEGKWERLRERDIEVDMQQRGEEVRTSRSCKNYRNVIGIPEYIRKSKKREGKKMQMIARWRCGNEERGNMFWMNEEERKCRVCEKEREDIKHMKEECVLLKKERWNRIEVLHEDGRGYEWMQMIEAARKKREEERERERERKRERERERERVSETDMSE